MEFEFWIEHFTKRKVVKKAAALQDSNPRRCTSTVLTPPSLTTHLRLAMLRIRPSEIQVHLPLHLRTPPVFSTTFSSIGQFYINQIALQMSAKYGQME